MKNIKYKVSLLAIKNIQEVKEVNVDKSFVKWQINVLCKSYTL